MSGVKKYRQVEDIDWLIIWMENYEPTEDEEKEVKERIERMRKWLEKEQEKIVKGLSRREVEELSVWLGK